MSALWLNKAVQMMSVLLSNKTKGYKNTLRCETARRPLQY